MDAHLFRRFCDAFLPHLPGTRLEKIHQPGPGVTVFTLYGMVHGAIKKHYLVLKAERKNPLIFVADHHIPVNAHPPAPVMRLRKYLSGQRIVQALADWPNRILYLQATGVEEMWLCLDLREGPSLLFSAPPAITEPAWPSDIFTATPESSSPEYSFMAAGTPEEAAPKAIPANTASPNTVPAGVLAEAPAEVSTDAGSSEAWRAWPVITPALRRTLPYLDALDAAALLMDLQVGGGDVFLYESHTASGTPTREISAWPLPAAQQKRGERAKGNWTEQVYEDVLAAIALAGESQVYAQISAKAREAMAKPFSAEATRLAKLQKKLDQEEERLQKLCAKQQDALLLQSQLYQFEADAKLPSVILESESGPHEVRLDPRLTVRENMAAMFHQAGRGKRGLLHLERRREAVAQERQRAEDAMLRSQAALSGTGNGGGVSGSHPSVTGKQPSNAPRKLPSDLPKQVQAFRSSDGFLLLRGRDTKGNGMVLKLAAPHDYWLHTAHGPSAHVIIRRDHAGQEVPERTLQEAGALAALKSQLRESNRAEIQYSLAKYIRPMKKAAPGTVRIDRSEGTFWTELNPALEDKLKA